MPEKNPPQTNVETVEAGTATETPENPVKDKIVEGLRARTVQVVAPSSLAVKAIKLFHGEVMTLKEITPETVKEVTDYYRLVFGNTMHFAVCPDCEQKGLPARLTARQAFGTGKEFVPLAQMDDPGKRPDCPCCKNKMEYFYDPETINDNFRQKLTESDESFLSILRAEDESLAGLAFAYFTNLKRELELEWGSKYPYMKKELQKPEYQRSWERFLAGVSQVFPGETFQGHEKFLAWNCMSVSPASKGFLPHLMCNMFNAMPTSMRDERLLGDVKRDSPAHMIFKTLGGGDGEGFFEDQGDILIGGPMRDAMDNFNLPPEMFKDLKMKRTGRK